jgi:hypothetical protein
MSGKLPPDRLPTIEWAMWWHLTLQRWHHEGLSKDLNTQQIKAHFGLDVDHQLWFPQLSGDGVFVADGEVLPGAMISDEADYERLLPTLYPRPVPFDRAHWKRVAELQRRGEIILWLTVEGFFWWPRRLFGIEPHLYAFYDSPELMKRINADQARYIAACVSTFCQEICTPDFLTVAEDMSYNHGPMIGKQQFDEFLAPFYAQVVPDMRRRGIHVLIDSDGDVEPLIPWFQAAGIEGILPLERMAGVDVNRIRRNHPKWKMIGGFDKTVMHLGEAAIRKEFDRLLPVMKSGYFIPSVDHQTPPAVSIEQYQQFVGLLKEYCARAVEGG